MVISMKIYTHPNNRPSLVDHRAGPFAARFSLYRGQKLPGKKSSPGQNEAQLLSSFFSPFPSFFRWRAISHAGRRARNVGKGIHGSLFLRRDERRDRNGGHKSLGRLSLNVIGSWPIGVVGILDESFLLLPLPSSKIECQPEIATIGHSCVGGQLSKIQMFTVVRKSIQIFMKTFYKYIVRAVRNILKFH